HHARFGHAQNGVGRLFGGIAITVFEIRAHRQVGGRAQLAAMREQFCHRHLTVEPTESEGQPRAGRRQRLETEPGQQQRRADVPRIRNHEAIGARVQRPEAFGLVVLAHHRKRYMLIGLLDYAGISPTTLEGFTVNTANLLVRPSTSFADHPAVALGPQVQFYYPALANRSARLAAALRERFELEAGARVCLAMHNTPAYVEILFAIWHAGLVAVPINAKLTPAEIGYIIEHSGA